jgi:hypothetical protein
MSELRFGEQAILLFLNEQDAKALLDILVECDLRDARYARDTERIRLSDRLAHAMDTFKVSRRLSK